jgi:hypothetical protein
VTKFQWPATQERASQHVIHTCWVTPSLANLKIRYYKDWTIIIYNYGMSVKNALGSWRITTPGPNQGRDANISHSLVLQHLQIWFPNYSNRVTIIFANAYKYFFLLHRPDSRRIQTCRTCSIRPLQSPDMSAADDARAVSIFPSAILWWTDPWAPRHPLVFLGTINNLSRETNTKLVPVCTVGTNCQETEFCLINSASVPPIFFFHLSNRTSPVVVCRATPREMSLGRC